MLNTINVKSNSSNIDRIYVKTWIDEQTLNFCKSIVVCPINPTGIP